MSSRQQNEKKKKQTQTAKVKQRQCHSFLRIAMYCSTPIPGEWIVNSEISVKEWIEKKNKTDHQLEPIRARHNSIDSSRRGERESKSASDREINKLRDVSIRKKNETVK